MLRAQVRVGYDVVRFSCLLGMEAAVLDGHAARLAPDPIADGPGREAFYRASRKEEAWIPNPYEVDPPSCSRGRPTTR